MLNGLEPTWYMYLLPSISDITQLLDNHLSMDKCDLLLRPFRDLLQAIDRRERLRRLALETIDLSKDPYFMRNHLGQVTATITDCICTRKPSKRIVCWLCIHWISSPSCSVLIDRMTFHKQAAHCAKPSFFAYMLWQMPAANEIW